MSTAKVQSFELQDHRENAEGVEGELDPYLFAEFTDDLRGIFGFDPLQTMAPKDSQPRVVNHGENRDGSVRTLQVMAYEARQTWSASMGGSLLWDAKVADKLGKVMRLPPGDNDYNSDDNSDDDEEDE
jgi:hypothetical protein